MPTNTILVAGGAGYIGSHFCHVAAERGFTPIIVDRIGPSSKDVEAYRRKTAHRFPLEICDIADEERVADLVAQHAPVAAVCFAALIDVAQSMANPELYWDHNYLRPMGFFRVLSATGVRHLVFSSTAAVYDSSTGEALSEGQRLYPASTYGLTKLACELMLQGATGCHRVEPGVRLGPVDGNWPPLPNLANEDPANFAPRSSLIFRYFNAAGAHPSAGLGEVHDPETHLIPNAIAAAMKARPLTINGDDYPTNDGTCVRDYIHALDLAEAHVAGLEYLVAGGRNEVINLGCGSGYSIKEVVSAIETVLGVTIQTRIGPRRSGDPARLVADVTKAQSVLGWQPRRDLSEIVESAATFCRQFGTT